MNRFAYLTCLLGLSVLFCGADWLQFRGPNGASVTSDTPPPAQWSDTENVAWKVDLEGRGVSGPIVVGDQVIVTASSGVKQDRLHVTSFDVQTGEQNWSRQFWATGRTLTHPFSAVAAPTPASDGQRIFAFYSSNDLACLDLEGNLVWYRGLAFDFPKAGNDIGMAASPVVVGSTVVLQVEAQGDSFAAGVDTATGETKWKVKRDSRSNWSSPVAMPGKRNGQELVLLQSGSAITAHDANSGEEVWKFDLACATTPSPAVTGDRIYLPANGLTALDLPATATAPSLAWDSTRLSCNPASPIVTDNRVYTMNGAGVLSCGDVETGRRLWQVRIGGRHWGTPVVAGDRMYCINVDGHAKVVELGRKGKIIGESEFGEQIKSSPAVAGGALYVRSDGHLWKVAAPGS